MLITTTNDITKLEEIIKNEGNFLEFTYRNIDCYLKRNQLDALCGYCKIPSFLNPKINPDEIRVHGGVTYTTNLDGYNVFGFDCSHSGDYTPKYSFTGSMYRTKEYCIKECEKMVDQILIIEPKIKIYFDRVEKIEKIINI